MSKLTMRLLDYDGDVAQVSFTGVVGNTGAAYDGAETLGYALRDAVLAVTLGANAGYSFVGDDVLLNPARPSDPFAQKNIRWIARAVDDVNGTVRNIGIGTADLAQATIIYNGAPAMDLSTGAGAALKTAWEAYFLNEGHATTLEAVFFAE